MSILQKTATGAAWTMIASQAAAATTLVTSIVAARLMSPGALGQYALVSLLVALVASGATLFSGNYYVIVREPSALLLRTGATLELLLGAAAWFVVAAAAAVYVAGGGSPGFAALLVVAALVLPAGAYGNPYGPLVASFTREFAYKTPALAFLAVVLASTMTKLVLLTAGLGAWGLVAGDVVLSVGYGVTMLALVPAARRLTVDRKLARDVTRFGAPSAATSAMTVMSERGSELVVALVLGTHSLGIYYIATRLPAQLYQLGGNLSAPVLTAFSRSNPTQLTRGFTLVTRLSAFFIFAPLAFMIPLAEPFVTTVYGMKWAPAAAPLVLLTAAIAVRLTFWHVANLLKSRGRVKEIATLSALQLLLVIPLSLVGAWLAGVTGAAAAALCVELLLAIPKIRLARTVVPFATMRALGPPIVALIVGVLVAAAAAAVFPDGVALCTAAVVVCAWFVMVARKSEPDALTAIASSFRRRASVLG